MAFHSWASQFLHHAMGPGVPLLRVMETTLKDRWHSACPGWSPVVIVTHNDYCSD